MRYDEFRDRLHEALCEVRLLARSFNRPVETIDLANTERRWQLYIWQANPQSVEPFQVSAKVAFDWSPVDAARAYTCEEDLLTDLVGKKQSSLKTENRWTRVDLVLHATLPYGSTTPLPDSQTFGSWTYSISEKLDKLFTEIKGRKGKIVSVTGGKEDVKVEVRCDPDGVISLDALSITAFRIVRVPRVWDDPVRRDAEKGIGEQLTDVARRFNQALEEWTRGISELARWIRYAPPPETTEAEPGFVDEDDYEDEEGPETIH